MSQRLCLQLLALVVLFAISFSSNPTFRIPLQQHPLAVRLGYDPTSNTLNSVGRVRSYLTPEGSIVNVTLGDNGASYYCSVYIGSPGQKIDVVVDTGSSLTAVPSKDCVTDLPFQAPEGVKSKCGLYTYDNTTSNSSSFLSCSEKECDHSDQPFGCYESMCGFRTQYGDQSAIEGYIGEDILSFGGSLETKLLFGVIEEETSEFAFKPSSGILGLAYNKPGLVCQPSCIKPVYDYFVDNEHIPDVFGIYMKQDPSREKGGYMTLGGIDGGLTANTSLSYTKITQELYYVVKMESMRVADGASIQSDGFENAIVDSGTTFLLIPSDAWSLLVTYFQNKYSNLPGVANGALFSGNVISMSQSDVDQFPPITISLNGVDIVMYAQDYLLEVASGAYALAIDDIGNNQMTILGDTLMMAASYTVFDRENKRVGFSKSQPISFTSSSSRPWLEQYWPFIVLGAALGVCLALLVCIITVWRTRRPSNYIEIPDATERVIVHTYD